MLKSEQIPMAVVGLLDLRLKSGDSPRDALVAALAAWPGANIEFRRDSFMGYDGSLLILPLTTEKRDD